MRSRSTTSRQHGFTLVELVIVILILGILSAVALPRFVNLGTDARKAKADALTGAIRAAAQITRAAALVGSQTGATGTVTLDGTAVSTIYGYPAATANGITAAAGIDTTADKVTITYNATAKTATVAINGASGTCQIVYTESAAANNAPTIDGSGTSGC